ncbi:unnamed protein product [Moneuplotes crassus]|uniref:Uncharacterized protein n=1 Tax=Euplotes crassus TaxID=5936 RepID=A0AAD1XEM6_EUPCR|nr:unnamed protein product [Moneuplotes crassus]
MDKIFGFGVSTVLLPYFGTLEASAYLMSSCCRNSRRTWFENLKVFTEYLIPSYRLQDKIGKDGFFDSISDKDFEWLISLPITYFKFNIKIQKREGSTSLSCYRNFYDYLQELSNKMASAPEEMKMLYRINNHCRIFINANDDLKSYISIYDCFQEMGTDDRILDVKFTLCEYDFDESMYCPYFECSQVIMKTIEDEYYTDRYFAEYCPVSSDMPFFRKVNRFKCEVNRPTSLLYFLQNCKTLIDTLIVDYTTLVTVINYNKDSNELIGESIFSESLRKYLNNIKLINVKPQEREKLKILMDYILENLSLKGIFISLMSHTQDIVPDYCSSIPNYLFSKYYGLQEIYLAVDDTYHFPTTFKCFGRNVLFQIIHKDEFGVSTHTLFCEKVSIKETEVKELDSNVCYLTAKKFNLQGIRYIHEDELGDLENLRYKKNIIEKELDFKGQHQHLKGLHTLGSGRFNFKMFTDDAMRCCQTRHSFQ